jgi:hypothetical protein
MVQEHNRRYHLLLDPSDLFQFCELFFNIWQKYHAHLIFLLQATPQFSIMHRYDLQLERTELPMSAPREKKDQQDLFPTGLSEKQRKNQKEAADRRRKKITYTIVGIVSAIAVAALLIWNSGIIQRGLTVLTVGDTNYTAADVNYYYYQTYNQEYSYSKNYGSYGITTFDYTKQPEDQNYSTDSTTGAVTTYQQYFITTAEDDLKQVTAIIKAANDAGYTLSDDGKKTVQTSIESLKTQARSSGYSYAGYLKLCYGEYMSASEYEKCLTRAQLATEYYDKYSKSLTYNDDALNNYYTENKDTLDTYNYAYLTFTASVQTTDSSGNTISMTDDEKSTALETAKATQKANADAALADLKSGTSVADLITKYSPASSNADSKTVGSNLPSTYSSWLEDSSRKKGDADVVEYSGGTTSSSYYVLLYKDRYQDQAKTVDIRHILIKAATATDDTSTTDVDESKSAPTDEAMQTAHDKAQNLLDEWNADSNKSADTFATLANAKSEDTGSNTKGGLYEKVYNGQMFDAFNTWIMDSSRQPGDTTLIENTQSGQYGWHVVYFQGWENPVWKNSADSALRSNDTKTWLDGLTSALTSTHTNHFDSMVGVRK